MPASPPANPPLTPLARKLAERVAAFGPLSLHDYMEACLYDEEHGYYRKKDPVGVDGDFITAPEISQIFGELIGLWAGEVWLQMGQPAGLRLIELGPGRGTLMADALRALSVLPPFLSNATVHLVETSEPLQKMQRAALATAPVAASWHASLEDVPDGPAILIANEFFDCLPVRQYVFEAAHERWRERMVAFEDGAFRFALNSTEAGAVGAGGSGIEDGAIFEERPAVRGLVQAFATRSPFGALIIDYGYSRPSFGDTVQAVSRHRFAGLFGAPGESDLTAHVDFSHLKREAREAGLSAAGPMPMGEWLLRLGLQARLGQLTSRVPDEEAQDLRRGAARLADPAQMGALFKVLALTNGIAAPPPPFLEWSS